MAVKIRLRRIGRKKQPSYRVVVAEQTTPRDGAYIDAIGFYNPRRSPKAELRLDLDRVDYWVDRGAAMTTTVASLVRKARRGGDDRVELMPSKAAAQAEAAEAEAAAPAGADEPAAESAGAAVPAPEAEADESAGG